MNTPPLVSKGADDYRFVMRQRKGLHEFFLHIRDVSGPQVANCFWLRLRDILGNDTDELLKALDGTQTLPSFWYISKPKNGDDHKWHWLSSLERLLRIKRSI